MDAGNPAGVGERHELSQPGVVAGVGQVAFGRGEELEQTTLGILEDRADR